MPYHGNVVVGGAPDVHELAELVITKIALGPGGYNSYLLRCRYTDQQLLIDAADDARTLTRLVNGSLAKIVTTHQHADRWRALAEVVAATGATTYAGRLDAEAIAVPTDISVGDGDEIGFGLVRLRVLCAPGGTPGPIALLYDDPKGHPHLFTGERLRREAAGDCSTRLPDETWIYPAHGHDSTLGDQRPHEGGAAS